MCSVLWLLKLRLDHIETSALAGLQEMTNHRGRGSQKMCSCSRKPDLQ